MWGHTSFLVYVVFLGFWVFFFVLCLVSLVYLLLIASLILSNIYIFHENMYLQNLRSPVLHVQKVSFAYICLFIYINMKIISHPKINHRFFTKIQIQTLQYFNNDWFYKMWREKRKDTKGVIRSHKTIKDG